MAQGSVQYGFCSSRGLKLALVCFCFVIFFQPSSPHDSARTVRANLGSGKDRVKTIINYVWPGPDMLGFTTPALSARNPIPNKPERLRLAEIDPPLAEMMTSLSLRSNKALVRLRLQGTAALPSGLGYSLQGSGCTGVKTFYSSMEFYVEGALGPMVCPGTSSAGLGFSPLSDRSSKVLDEGIGPLQQFVCLHRTGPKPNTESLLTPMAQQGAVHQNATWSDLREMPSKYL